MQRMTITQAIFFLAIMIFVLVGILSIMVPSR